MNWLDPNEYPLAEHVDVLLKVDVGDIWYVVGFREGYEWYVRWNEERLAFPVIAYAYISED